MQRGTVFLLSRLQVGTYVIGDRAVTIEPVAWLVAPRFTVSCYFGGLRAHLSHTPARLADISRIGLR